MILKFPASKKKSKQNKVEKNITYAEGGITIVCIPTTPTSADVRDKVIVSITKNSPHRSFLESAMIQLLAMNEV